MAKILIVDDSRTSRRMLRNILVENGHEVIGEAENGQIGFEKYIELTKALDTSSVSYSFSSFKDKLKIEEQVETTKNILELS